MAFSILAAGGSLYRVTTAGVATALTLPSGVTISSTRPCRMSVFGRSVVITNGPTRSLFVDPEFVVRPLILRPPTSAPIVAAGAAGNYTGTIRAKYTFIVKDPESGALLSESPFSPISASVAITADLIAVTGIQKSPDSATTHRRLYRTATGPGTEYFHWLDLDGNTLTEVHDDASDASISAISAPTDLGAAPGMALGTFMMLLTSWKDRLFGVGNESIDTLVYTGNRVMYGWPNSVVIPQAGADQYGITGLMPRRDELGVAKRDYLWKLSGSSSSFDLIKVRESRGKGCWAPASVVIIDDIAYYLGENGLFTWGPNGVQSISDERARGWFATSTYFNKAQFVNAFGKYNSKYHGYELHLAAAGSSDIDRWIFYDIEKGRWWGPHRTTDFTPSHAMEGIDSNGTTVPIIGSTSGFLFVQNQSVFQDDDSDIPFELTTKFHDVETPDILKLFGQPSLISKIKSAQGDVTMAAKVGTLGASELYSVEADMRRGRQRFSHLGAGNYAQVRIHGTTSTQGVNIYGYEIPVHELGRR